MRTNEGEGWLLALHLHLASFFSFPLHLLSFFPYAMQSSSSSFFPPFIHTAAYIYSVCVSRPPRLVTGFFFLSFFPSFHSPSSLSLSLSLPFAFALPDPRFSSLSLSPHFPTSLSLSFSFFVRNACCVDSVQRQNYNTTWMDGSVDRLRLIRM